MSVSTNPARHSPLSSSDRPLPNKQWAKKSKELSEWFTSLQDYIEEREPKLNALASSKLDFTKGVKGSSELPLQFLTFGVKDIIQVDGFETRAGSLLPSHLWQGPEAKLVSRLRLLGGMPIAKTATTEFAYLEPGPTRNPWHTGYTPGGSSSGSAAGVAAGYFDISIGTQTVGSVIRPASFCGVCGFKPSRGLLSRDGVMTFSKTVDQVGFFSRHWRDLIAVSRHLKISAAKSSSNLNHLRFGMISGEYLNQADAAMIAQVRNFAQRLEQTGWKVSETGLPLDSIFKLNRRHQDLIAHEFYLAHQEWFSEYGYLYRPGTVKLFENGASISETRYSECKESCLNWRNKLKDFLKSNQIDILICPSAIGTATPSQTSTGNPVMNLPWTHGGMPVTSIPLGLIQNDENDWLPIGAQLVASFERDGFLLEATQLISQRLGLSSQQKLSC